jgi:hypothetical protein
VFPIAEAYITELQLVADTRVCDFIPKCFHLFGILFLLINADFGGVFFK